MNAAVPAFTVLPPTSPTMPDPGMDCIDLTGRSHLMPIAAALPEMAAANGWLLPLSRLPRSLSMLEMSHKAGGVPALGAAVMTSADILTPDSAIMNVPFVSVPVLSKDTTLMDARFSRISPPLISTPDWAALARADTTVTGVDSTSAQGHAITSTSRAR